MQISQGGTPKNGIDAAGEWVSFLFSLEQGKTFSDFLAATNHGTFRLGVKAQAFESGGSEWLLSDPPETPETPNTPVVPEPATIALMGLGVVGLGGYLRRRGQQRSVAA